MTDYRDRPEIREALRGANMTAGEFARRQGINPSTFRGQLCGNNPMDEAAEKKVLSDIQAMGGEG